MGLLRFPDPLCCRRRKVTAMREEGGRGRKRRRQLGGLLCLLITRHICIHVRASPRLAALTFSLNVIVCNNLMPPVSLRPLLQQATSPLSLSVPLPSWLLHRRHDCLFWCSIVAVCLRPSRTLWSWWTIRARGANIHARFWLQTASSKRCRANVLSCAVTFPDIYIQLYIFIYNF